MQRATRTVQRAHLIANESAAIITIESSAPLGFFPNANVANTCATRKLPRPISHGIPGGTVSATRKLPRPISHDIPGGTVSAKRKLPSHNRTALYHAVRCGAVRCDGTQNCTIKYSHHTARYHASRPLVPSAEPQETCGAIDRSAGAVTLPQQTNGIPCAHCCAAHGPHRIASHRIASHRIASHRSVATSTASVAQRLSAWQQQRVERSRARRCVATR